MNLSIGFYLIGLHESHQKRVARIINELNKVGIRCYLSTDIKPQVFFGQNHQYCILRKDIPHLFSGEGIQGQDPAVLKRLRQEYFRKEKEFRVKRNMKIIISNIPELLNSITGKERVVTIDYNVMPVYFHNLTNLQVSGAILKRMADIFPARRYAVLDVGTNNILMVWAEVSEGKINVIHRGTRISSLGKNMHDNMLTTEGIRRAKWILTDFISLSKYVCDEIIILGTSCSRESKNIDMISNWLRKKYDLPYKIITEEEEAQLAGLANRNLFAEHNELILFDIGGGSTEFIYYRGDEMLYHKSLSLGIRRLTSRKGGRYNIKGTQNIKPDKRDEIRRMLAELEPPSMDQATLVGIGGTVTNISAVKQRLHYYDSKAVHKTMLTKEDIEYYLEHFKNLTLRQIAALMPFEPLRADVITTGLMIVLEIMEHFEVEHFFVSDYGIQFGILELIASGKGIESIC